MNTAVDVTTGAFSFLVAGPSYEYSMPSDFSGQPELSSPVAIGTGGRSFVFTPAPRAADLASKMSEASAPVNMEVTDGDGRVVDVRKRLSDPPTWWLLWNVSSGIVTAHVRDEDGEDA